MSSNAGADLLYIPSKCVLQKKNETKTNLKRSHASLKALVESTCLGQQPGEFIIKWDCWEGKPLVQILTTSLSGMLPYTVQVAPPLAALHKDSLNMAMFIPEPKTFAEIFFFPKIW